MANQIDGQTVGKMGVQDFRCGTLTVNGTDVTDSISELAALDGVTASAAEINVLDGVTGGTVTASKAVVVDANKDIGDFRNVDGVNIDAGASGTAGTVDVFPTTASKGKLSLAAVDNDGDTTTTLSNAAMGQASVISFPDPGAATANVVLTDAANDGVLVTATAAELNQADVSAVTGTMSASTAVAAAATAYDVTTHRTGNIIKTTIYIDLTGLKSTTTANDIIGDTGASHIGQITTAVNGVIYGGTVKVAEVPATGDTDIDLSMASVATGAYDADVTALTNYAALMAAGGALAVGAAHPLTAVPTADYYLYLSVGSAGGTPGTYTAGIIVIELYGLAS